MKMGYHDKLEVQLPDGRILHVWTGPEMDDHACVDVWTTRGHAVEEISANTGDTTRAAMGGFTWINGNRQPFAPSASEFSEHGWAAVATVTLLWDREVGS